MLFEHPPNVEGIERAEKRVPNDGDHYRGKEELREFRERIVGQFTTLITALNNFAQQLPTLADYIAMIELSDPGKARPLGDDKAQDALARRPEHLALKKIDDFPKDNIRR